MSSPVTIPTPASHRPAGVVAERVAWGCLAAAAAGLAVCLVRYWGTHLDHADRLLVLAGSVWAALQIGPAARSRSAHPRPAVGLGLVAVGSAAIPLGWDVQNHAGMMPGIVMWWEAAGLLAAAVGLILTRHGWPRLRAVAFPLVFPLFVLPVPNAVLGRLQPVLQEVTATAAEWGLSALGVAVERDRFVLRLPSGDLGVAEACSGVQSLTALTAAAAFVAFLRRFGPARGCSLVALTVPLVAAVNAVRVVITGVIQEAVGTTYVEGIWHEGVGLGTVLLGVAGVLGLARMLGTPGEGSVPQGCPFPPPGAGGPWAVRAAAVLLAAAAALSAAAAAAAPASRPDVDFPFDDVPDALPGGWRADPTPAPHNVAEMLATDRLFYRKYANNLGHEGHVWLAGWGTTGAARGYHHPDVCFPNRGFSRTDRGAVRLPIRGGGDIPVTLREFRRNRDEMFVVYWSQTGRSVWTESDEAAAFNETFGWQIFGRSRIAGELRPGAEPRLMVLVGAMAGGPAARRETLDLAGAVAEALYRVCDWADPRGHRSQPGGGAGR